MPGPDDGGEPFDGAQEPRDSLAPVIPLFGGPPAETPAEGSSEPEWRSTWSAAAPVNEAIDERTAEAEAAEKSLLRKLRARSLSVSEARTVILQHGTPRAEVDDLVLRFEDMGYLDDAALAEQLVHSGVDRKDQGRRAIGQTLAKRGIPRDVADAALAQLPDDDGERALEYARTKARSLSKLDRDTALRRLAGQLARRGYGGSAAFDAARTALDEVGGGGSGGATISRVAFRDS